MFRLRYACAILLTIGLALLVNSSFSALNVYGQTGIAAYAAPAPKDGGCRVVMSSPNPGQDGNYIRGLAAISPNDVWAVGYYDGPDYSIRSLTLHWDGSAWTQIPSPNPDNDYNILWAIDAFSSKDIWAVGEKGRNAKRHFAIHWDGSAWTEVPVPNRAEGVCVNRLSGVTVTSEGDAWAAGYTNCEPPGLGRNVTVHWNGHAWSQEYTPNLTGKGGVPLYNAINAIDAASQDDVWAVGRAGSEENPRTLTMHWDGYEWNLVPAPPIPLFGLQAVAALSHNDVWAGGTDILHWDGSSWSQSQTSRHADERRKTKDEGNNLRPSGNPNILSVSASSPDNVWAIGQSFMRWDGTNWSTLDPPDPGPDINFLYLTSIAVTRSDPTVVWGAGWSVPIGPGPRRTFIFRDTCYAQAATRTATPSITGTPPTVTRTPTSRLTRTATRTHTATATSTGTATATATQECGIDWRIVNSANVVKARNELKAVSALTMNDAWAVGNYTDDVFSRTLILHWNGSAWTPSIVPDPGPGGNVVLKGVAAVSANNVWAVGSFSTSPPALLGPPQTAVLHWDGSIWNRVSSPNPDSANELFAVSALSANDIWAVGYSGAAYGPYRTLIEHWDGTQWSVVTSPAIAGGNSYLAGVTAVSANDAWAVGWRNDGNRDIALTVHWNGSQWSVVANDSPNSSNRLYAISASGPNNVWAVGWYFAGSPGFTLMQHWNGTAWTRVTGPGGTGTLYGVLALDTDNVWTVGTSGASQTLIQHLDGDDWFTVQSPERSPGTNQLYGLASLRSGGASNYIWSVGSHDARETLVKRYSNPCLYYTPTPTITPGGSTLTPTRTATQIPMRTPTPTFTPGGAVRDSAMILVPEGSAPPNGGTAHVGDRFVLGLWVNGNSHFDASLQMSYLTFTYSLLQNARVDQIASSCVLTSTVTRDPELFELEQQNQVCNGPAPCNFRDGTVEPGYMAYASTTAGDCPDVGCTNYFRVARIGLCAVAPGQARLRWQFSPPAPSERDTQLWSINGYLINQPATAVDYIITIANSTPTPNK